MSHSEIATDCDRHAIVIGGSIAGLLAARVLTDHFDQVTVIERDRFPEQPEWRPGVPQSNHPHILLTKGQEILEQLFPGLQDELAAAGAPLVDWMADFPFLGVGGWSPRFSSHLKTHTMTRNLLEWKIRQRLMKSSSIRFLPVTQVIGLLSDAERTKVIGVQVLSNYSSEHSKLFAHLVVDATGRNSQAPQWLTALGYPSPEETVINSFLGYASRWYQRPAHLQIDWQAIYLLPKPPHLRRGGLIFSVEGVSEVSKSKVQTPPLGEQNALASKQNRWIVTLTGIAKDYPPTDEAGFLDFARTLQSPVLYEAIKDAQPLSPIYGYRNTENRWRHYEKLSRLPENFIVMGDAVCAFNPVYGQGMAVAALGTLTLNQCLKQQHRNNLAGLAKRFQKQLAKVNVTPWLMATAEDLRWQSTEGGRPNLVTRLLHRYTDQVMLLSSESPYTYKTWSEVIHLQKPSTALFQPRILARLLWRAIYLGRQDQEYLQEQNIPKRPRTQQHPV